VFVIPKTRNLNEETEMVRNKWTRKEQQKLDKIESSLVKKGVPEHQARFMAEPILEQHIVHREEKRAEALERERWAQSSE
jgi:hypothetical protein